MPSSTSESFDLTGKLLIAMPGMGDMRFQASLILICAHSDDGAMGLIVNKPTADVRLFDLFDQLSIARTDDACDQPVHIGGPVEHARGFVLHGTDYSSPLNTLDIPGGFGMTATQDVLEAMAHGQGPERALVMLGYAGWGGGQLEDEVAQNGWLTCEATQELVFATPDARKWEAALASLGIDAMTLSSSAGRA
ncbi:YqgE/AlgH family protein [Sediminimonas sp.]|jgi:putative transcriptional regulator|uniref:YqgE/AlgH family protein n=1 Tax=Sediminimonas sp. TaxID=2823379 RepID=UPI0025DDA2E3|nr:YqgE/AlgH family protein [Sediminimonas sp.]